MNGIRSECSSIEQMEGADPWEMAVRARKPAELWWGPRRSNPHLLPKGIDLGVSEGGKAVRFFKVRLREFTKSICGCYEYPLGETHAYFDVYFVLRLFVLLRFHFG